MVKLIDKTKISIVDYLYMLFIIIYAAQASAFVRGLGDPMSVGNILAVVFTIVMIVKHRVHFNKNYVLSIVILVVYTILTFIAHDYTSLGFIPRWFIYLSIAYVICKVYGFNIYCVIESVLIPLIIISMIMWVLHLLYPSDVYSFVDRYSLPTFSKDIDYITKNCIFYTINGDEEMKLADYYMFRRNPGFAWEPGAYSCFACLGIACHLIRQPRKLLSISMIIYLAAIATSQSTTGVFILGAVFLVWMIISKKVLWASLFTPLYIFVAGLSFVSEKFMNEFVDISSAGSNLNAVAYHGRLFGLEASLSEFVQHPLIGLGGKRDDTYLDSIGISGAIYSGIGNMLTTFGIVMTVLFFYLLFKNVKILESTYNNRGGYYIIVVIVLSMISYQLWQQPLFLALAFMCIYGPNLILFSNKKIKSK